MLLKNELRFLFSKRNILVLILVLIGVLSVYFFKYNTEYEQYASNQIMYYYEKSHLIKWDIDIINVK